MKKELILVGDRVLIQPDTGADKTEFGLYLPQGVKEKEKVQAGVVIKTGPGYAVWDVNQADSEPWKSSYKTDEARYLPLQAKVGDYCIFLRDAGIEIEFERNKYVVVPHSAILVIIRGDIKEKLGI
jgi:co-chaperonin GroES (HSP10)